MNVTVTPSPTPSPKASESEESPQSQQPRGTMDFSSAGGSTNDFSSLSHASFEVDTEDTVPVQDGSSVTPGSTSSAVSTNVTSPSLAPPGSPLSPSRADPSVSNAAPSPSSSTRPLSSSSADLSGFSSSTQIVHQATTNAAAVLAQEQAKKKAAAAARAAEKKMVETQALRAMKNRMYQKTFNLPATEQLIEDYSAAIKKTILLHGRLYISWNHICFFSSIFSHKTSLVLNVSEIIWVAAASVALVFDNSIRIYVQSGPLPIPKVDSRGNIVPLPGFPLLVDKNAPVDSGTASGNEKGSKGSGSASPAIQKDPSPAPVTSSSSSSSGSGNAAKETKSDLTVSVSAPLPPPIAAPYEHAVRPGSTSPLASDGTRNEEFPATGPTSSTTPAITGTSPSIGPTENPADIPPPAELLATAVATATTATTALPPAHAQSQAVGNNMPDLSSSNTTPVYADPIPTTNNASMDLTAQQLQYLIAIQHPNITTHFFASFLMRDHALSLIDGLLKKRREANPTWVAMQQAWTQADDERKAANAQAAAVAAAVVAERKKNEAAAQAAAAAQAQLNDMSPPGSPEAVGSTSSSPAGSSNDPGAAFNLSFVPTSPSSSTGGGEAFVSPPPTTTVSEMKESASYSSITEPPKARLAKKAGSAMNLSSAPESVASPPVLSLPSASVTLPTFTLTPRLDFGGDGLAPPPDDFTTPKIELDEVVDVSFPGGISSRGFFDLFMGDLAIFTAKEFCALASKGDTDWILSSWFSVPGNQPVSAAGTAPVNKHGPWVRDVKYKKLIVGSPLGPPVTRVHSQAVYTATDSSVKVESRNLTPDVPFGENLYVLERIQIEDSSSGCRVRVSVAVRFIKQPWKMKPFVSLIRSKTKEDVQAWYTNWLKSIKDYIRSHPTVVQAALQRALGPDAPVIVLPPVAAALEGETAPVAPSDAGRSHALEGKQDSDEDSAFAGVSTHLPAVGPPAPLAEWTWLRDGLALVPVLSDHAPTIISGVNAVREATRGYDATELIFGWCLFACALSFLAEQPSVFGFLFSLLLPWRWVGLITSARPELWLAAAALCMLVNHRSHTARQHELMARIQLAQRSQSQHTRKIQHQLDELKRTMSLAQKSGSTSSSKKMVVDEHHFK